MTLAQAGDPESQELEKRDWSLFFSEKLDSGGTGHSGNFSAAHHRAAHQYEFRAAEETRSGAVGSSQEGSDLPDASSRSLSSSDCFNGPNCYEPHFEVLEASGSSPSARAGMRVALHNSSGAMFVFGGTTSDDFLNDMYVYKLLEHTWVLCRTNGDPPPQVLHPTIALWEAEYTLFLFGGVDALGDTPGPGGLCIATLSVTTPS
ncbi:unnamed protein product [Prorocentrum cordatum]|uniref:Uncharacterized protein n=1 Tax=Prorocentrum cordatum TaxID=2364126 RepID=A0ABN9WSD5_9DINO|nr:unnamed protein product [Polarella glacialis]